MNFSSWTVQFSGPLSSRVAGNFDLWQIAKTIFGKSALEISKIAKFEGHGF